MKRLMLSFCLCSIGFAACALAQEETAPPPEPTRAPEASKVPEAKKPTSDEILAEAKRIEYEKQLAKLPKKGNLSSTVVGGTSSAGVSMPWGHDDKMADEGQSPISGSVSKTGKGEAVARIFNNTEDRFSASFEVVQLDIKGKRVKSDHFSVSIGPKQTVERKIKTLPATDRSNLNMTSWKNLSRKIE